MTETSKLARSAVAWTTAFNLFRDVLQFGTMLVLVRLIDPDAYGLFAQTTATVSFIAVFSAYNFVAHVLQARDVEEADFQCHFTAGAVLQGLAFLIANLVALILAHSGTAYAAIANPLHVASFTFVVEWPCELRRRMLEREFRWRRLNSLHAIGIAIAAVTSLALAFMGLGVYALVGPGMLQAVPFVWDLFVAARWRPDWSWSSARYRAAWVFGMKRTGSGLAVAGRTLLESSVISAVAGFAVLGIFNRAMGLMQLCCVRPAAILGSATYPLLPRLEPGSAHQVRAGDLLTRIVGWIVVPTGVAIGALAGPIVAILYGERWLSVVPLLPLAMANGVALALIQIATSLLLGGQRPGLTLFVDAVLLAGTVVGLVAVLPHGVATYLAYLAAVLIVLLLVLIGVLCHLRLASVSGLLLSLAAPLVASGVAAVFASLIIPHSRLGIPDYDAAHAAIWGTIFGFGYLVIMRTIFGRPLRELVERLPGRRTIGRMLAYRGLR